MEIPSFKNLKYAYDYFGSVPPPFENLIGYSPEAQLGIGGFGATILYKNNKNNNDKKVVKIITPRGKSTYDREVSILKVLGNKKECDKYNITCFDKVITFPELYFYSMDYIPGATLWEYLKNMKNKIPRYDDMAIDSPGRPDVLTWELYIFTMKKMMISLVKSLTYIHEKGVIHNDVKGNNIIIKNVRGVATPVLIDFGLSEVTNNRENVGVSLSYHPSKLWHPKQKEYYSGFFNDAILVDYYGLKRTFLLPEVPTYNMLYGIPPRYSNDDIYLLCEVKKTMTNEDWFIFFKLIYRIDQALSHKEDFIYSTLKQDIKKRVSKKIKPIVKK